jgi:hypothetical protein
MREAEMNSPAILSIAGNNRVHCNLVATFEKWRRAHSEG